MIDTGGSCLTLPSEIFDDLKSWWEPLSSSTISKDDFMQSLPVLKFTMADLYTLNGNGDNSDENSEELVIHLSNLLVNKSDISIELSRGSGLLVSSLPSDDSLAVCILRGLSVFGPGGQMRIPHISMGSLVLRSLYFAADYTSGGVGLANKNNTNKSYKSDNDAYNYSFCKSQVSCVGQQRLDDFSNTCVEPDCFSYFFVDMDENTHTYDDDTHTFSHTLFFSLCLCMNAHIYYLYYADVFMHLIFFPRIHI